MEYISLNLQSTNAEHSKQLVDYQTQTGDNRTTPQSVTRLLMQVYLS